MTALIGSILVFSLVSTIFWARAGLHVTALVRGQPYLHLVTIYLTVGSFLLLNAFTISAIARWLNADGLSFLFGFMTGVQMVAGISAFLFVQHTGLRRRS